MAWTVHELATTLPSCPCCASALLELSDMWGAFYACEECGYEVEDLQADLEIRYTAPLRQAVLASTYRVDQKSRHLEGRRICQVSVEAPGSPWAS
jgi:DNA-directed RNA polymerase subunit M/transcription elongation factor TFIIS